MRIRALTARQTVGAAFTATFALAAVVLPSTVPASAEHAPAIVPPYEWACQDRQVPEDGFTDVPDGGAHEPAVDCAVWHGLTAGTTSTTFAPRAVVTRAQMATFLGRLLTSNSGVLLPGEPPDAFDDDSGSPHERTIDQLAAAGLLRGTGERMYSPGAAVTRAQMASYLVRAFEYKWRFELPQARERFSDDTGSIHERSIDQLAGLRIASGVSAMAYAPDMAVTREQMARFLVTTQGCLGFYPQGEHRDFPRCDLYTDTDGAQALQGFEVELHTNADHYTSGQPVGVLVRACNRRSTELAQVFPQKDWFVVQALHEALNTEDHAYPWSWYDHHWSHSLNRSGYEHPRNTDALFQRIAELYPKLSAVTWYDGPQTGHGDVVVWQPGECKSLDVGGWQQGHWRYSDDTGSTANFPGHWVLPTVYQHRTEPGWHVLRLHWGGVEVGQARRYLSIDSRRFHLEGPRLSARIDERAYRPDEQVVVTVSACNDSDRPYRETFRAGNRIFTLYMKGSFHQLPSEAGHVLAEDDALDWPPASAGPGK